MPFLITTTSTRVHNWCSKLLATLLLLGNLCSLQATSIGNYAEMGLALATIPLDIAANKHDLAKNTRKAAIYHLAADSLSVLNKAFFIYNDLNNQYQLFQRFAPINRDLLVNYSCALLDLKRILKNINILAPTRKKPIVNQATTEDLLTFDFDEDDADMAINQIGFDDLLDFDFEEEEFSVEETSGNEEEVIEEEEKELSQLVQRWRTVILPTLKGLTAFALACAQNNATPYENISRRNARYLAASTHALTRLLAEYSTLTAKSQYKKTIIITLMLNVAWLAYEIRNYIATMPEPEIPDDLGPRIEQPLVRMHRENGRCNTCWEDAEIAQLDCGHTACLECLRDHINEHPLNNIPCIAGCGRNITREEFRDITDDNPRSLATFDAACRPVRAITREQAAALGAKPCPGRGCGVPIYRFDGCQHMTCNRCGHEFCWICLGNYRNNLCAPYRCAQPFDLDI